MIDREKVIKATEICLSGGKPDRCRSCPYHLDGCDRQRMLDTLALLKEQERRINELEEKLRLMEYGDQDILQSVMMPAT